MWPELGSSPYGKGEQWESCVADSEKTQMYLTKSSAQGPTHSPAPDRLQPRAQEKRGLDYASAVQTLSPAEQPGYDVQRSALAPSVQMKGGGGGGGGVQEAASQGGQRVGW